MEYAHVRYLILVNREGALMGLVSDKDILKLISGVSDIELEGRDLSEVMLGDLIRRKLLTVNPDAQLLDIAQAMLEQRLSALHVVTAEDELKGIITRTDLLLALVNGKLEAWYSSMLTVPLQCKGTFDLRTLVAKFQIAQPVVRYFLFSSWASLLLRRFCFSFS